MKQHITTIISMLDTCDVDQHCELIANAPALPMESFSFAGSQSELLAPVEELTALKASLYTNGATSYSTFSVYNVIVAISKQVPVLGLGRTAIEWFTLMGAVGAALEVKNSQRLWDVLDREGREFIDLLAWYVYEVSRDPYKGGSDWGKENLIKEPDTLKTALLVMQISVFQQNLWQALCTLVDGLSMRESYRLHRMIYRLAGSPETTDSLWGLHNLYGDQLRLIKALQVVGAFSSYSCTADYCGIWEDEALDCSIELAVTGRELNRGSIGYIGSGGISLEDYRREVQTFSDHCCNEHEVDCVYTASMGKADYVGSLYSRRGILLPAARLLIENWSEFFATKSYARYLQICKGHGASIVYAALQNFPDALKKRIIVLAIDPDYLITREHCQRAISVLTEECARSLIASAYDLPEQGRELRIYKPESTRQRLIRDMVDRYIWTNDIAFSG